jgi:hypothetical protein
MDDQPILLVLGAVNEPARTIEGIGMQRALLHQVLSHPIATPVGHGARIDTWGLSLRDLRRAGP